MSLSFPFYRQQDSMDCGPTCVRILAKHHGKVFSSEFLREKCQMDHLGVSMLGISNAVEAIGMRALVVQIPFEKLAEESPMPCIVHWRQKHFVVVYKIKKGKVYVSDPAHGLLTYTKEEFLNAWAQINKDTGVVLFAEPTPEFYIDKSESKKEQTRGFDFFFSYLIPYKAYFLQLALAFLSASILQLIFPFLTQAVVDVGIGQQNIGFIYTSLIAQIMLTLSSASVDMIRSWILLHIASRINISILSDFLTKLMKLPISFFDTKTIGDLLQRIGDHQRIQNFIMSSPLNVVFSILNLFVFGIIMLIYSPMILLVFFIGSIFSTTWIFIFLKKRRDLDYKRFSQSSENQSKLIQLITGIQEIKLNGGEKQKRWEWERIQAKLFKISVEGLTIGQYQQTGNLIIEQMKNVTISFLSAKEVIDGHITLGAMMALSYIIGQLNAPISQLLGLIQSVQDTKISLDRLQEVYNKQDEEQADEETVNIFPEERDINIYNMSFHYPGTNPKMVLKNINLQIPSGKVTAIVGASGSGKTTLLKLLLKFYSPTSGEIKLGGVSLGSLNSRLWRQRCGIVMQEGFIFSDTIANNIGTSDEKVNRAKLLHAVRMANIQEFIESLPLGYATKIGSDGYTLSQGQKQRVLIARAIYKDPEYLFFDEATSALDANNERIIIENLEEFFRGKTVVVIAHRLSTVKKAHQIIVLNAGEVVEQGTHIELTRVKGIYYELVKNQLELEN